jgi:hypothetical protein
LLRFELHQIRLEGPRRYYLPLPKLSEFQLELVAARLLRSGLSVRRTQGRVAAEGDEGTTVISQSGLASSNSDMLDLLSPAIPPLLDAPKEPSASNPYFAAKRRGDSFEIQLFARMEGLRLWSELRKEGKCGLTPDEKEVITHLLARAEGSIQCVTDYPTDGCSLMRFGRKQYYRSLLPVREFSSRLRVIDSQSVKNSYLPRSSVLKLKTRSIPSLRSGPELGEWCFLTSPKSL